VVDDLDQKLEKKMEYVREAIRKWDEQAGDGPTANGVPNPFKLVPETTKEQFLKVIKRDRECMEKLNNDDIDEIFNTVY
jgi:hypothetical protein